MDPTFQVPSWSPNVGCYKVCSKYVQTQLGLWEQAMSGSTLARVPGLVGSWWQSLETRVSASPTPHPPPWSRCSFPVAAVASYPIPGESSLTGTKIKVWAGFSPSGRYRGVGSLPLPASGGRGQPLAGGHITPICLCGRFNSSCRVRCSPRPSRTNTCDGILCSPRMQSHLPISWSFLTLSQLQGPFCHVRSQVPLDPDWLSQPHLQDDPTHS